MARPLIYLAPNRWHGPRQRTQHLAAGLARTRAVVFVEPAAYTLPGAMRRRLAGERRPLHARLERPVSDVTVYSPPPTVPGNLHVRALNTLVHALAWRGLRRAVPAIVDGPLDVLIGWPPAVELARRLRPRRLVYDCLDLFPSFEHGLRRRLLASTEEDLSRAAFAVVVPSRALERRWSRRHPRVARIPNGVELGVFGDAAPVVAPEIDRLPGPRLGYVGTVGRWVDLPLLRHVAERRPECCIAVVGPLEPGTVAPVGPANLVLLGERPYASLPAYLAGMDVLLIPFRLMELTHAVNPIKLYEYCATGKPIVATPIEDIVAEGDLCHVGAGPEAFLAAVDAALREARRPDPARTAARRSLAWASSWDRRVAALAALLDEADASGT